jgi:hypothetical protein
MDTQSQTPFIMPTVTGPTEPIPNPSSFRSARTLAFVATQNLCVWLPIIFGLSSLLAGFSCHLWTRRRARCTLEHRYVGKRLVHGNEELQEDSKNAHNYYSALQYDFGPAHASKKHALFVTLVFQWFFTLAVGVASGALLMLCLEWAFGRLVSDVSIRVWRIVECSGIGLLAVGIVWGVLTCAKCIRSPSNVEGAPSSAFPADSEKGRHALSDTDPFVGAREAIDFAWRSSS